MADVQRNAALAGVLVVELAAHVGVLHPRQRAGRRIARGSAADRRHRGEPRVGIVLPLDLEAFGAHRGEEARAAGGRQEPGEIEDLHTLQRKRLVVQRRDHRAVHRLAAAPGTLGAARRFAQHRFGVLAQQRRAPADLPAGLGGQPFAGRVAERCGHARDVARRRRILRLQPVLVERVLMRLANRRPQQAGILRLRHGMSCVGPGADEALHDIQHMRPRFVAWPSSRAPARAFRSASGGGGCRSACMPYLRQQRHQVLQVARAHAVRDEPAPILGMHDAGRMVWRLHRMPAGQPPQRHAPHHPVHDVEFGIFRHRLMHRHRNVLALPGAMAVRSARR